MTGPHHNAFDALIAEILGFDHAITMALLEEQEARDRATAARQALDEAMGRRVTLEGRRKATEAALRSIQVRDGVGDDVVVQLLERSVAP